MKTSCGKFFNLAQYFPYDVKLRLLAHSQSFLANQKVRNAIVGAENLLNENNLTVDLLLIKLSDTFVFFSVTHLHFKCKGVIIKSKLNILFLSLSDDNCILM